MSAVATVGLKTTCLDLELDKNYATCLSSGTADVAIFVMSLFQLMSPFS